MNYMADSKIRSLILWRMKDGNESFFDLIVKYVWLGLMVVLFIDYIVNREIDYILLWIVWYMMWINIQDWFRLNKK